MSVLVDTNVLSDAIHDDQQWRAWSVDRLLEYYGQLLINPMVYAELGCRAKSVTELETALAPFELDYVEIPKSALFLASQVFLTYRRRGGSKTAPLPDFFIGAHAATLEVPILTRDVGRYQSYFPEVNLIVP